MRTGERTDSLGKKMIFSGVLEDSTYKVAFISHKIGVPLSKNSVYKFQSVYVHEFEKDKSLVLVATENSKIEPRSADGARDFVWNPKISSIKKVALKKKVEEVIEKGLPLLQAEGMLPIKYEGKREQQSDIQNLRDQLEAEIREKLYGRNINARGSVLIVHDEPWFFPNYIEVY